MGWVALIVVLIALAYGASILAGALLPSQSVAATSIRKELQRRGLVHVPELAVEEMAKFIVGSSKLQIAAGTQKGPINSLLQDKAKLIAMWVEGIVMGDEDHSPAKIRRRIAIGAPDPILEILAKYQPKLFSLENLEKTQLANSLLLEAHLPSTKGHSPKRSHRAKLCLEGKMALPLNHLTGTSQERIRVVPGPSRTRKPRSETVGRWCLAWGPIIRIFILGKLDPRHANVIVDDAQPGLRTEYV